jgi:hypothetical protein
MHTNFQDALYPPCNVAGNFKIFNATDSAYMMIRKNVDKRPEPILDDFYSFNFSTLTHQRCRKLSTHSLSRNWPDPSYPLR